MRSIASTLVLEVSLGALGAVAQAWRANRAADPVLGEKFTRMMASCRPEPPP